MIIDFHTHAFSEKIVKRAMEGLAGTSGLTPFTDGTVGGLISRMDKSGVDISVILPIATKPSQHTVINDWAASIRSERIYPFGSVHPFGDDALETAERIKSLGLYGIKLHPDYQDFYAGDKKAYPLYDLCQQIDMPITFHAGFDPLCPDLIHGTPEMFEQIHKDFPRLTMILAHMGGMYRWDIVERHIAGTDGNVFLDTAVVAGEIGEKMLGRLVQKHGADRILMASDCPWDDPAEEIKMIDSLDISDSDKEKILYKNAEKLLKIK